MVIRQRCFISFFVSLVFIILYFIYCSIYYYLSVLEYNILDIEFIYYSIHYYLSVSEHPYF